MILPIKPEGGKPTPAPRGTQQVTLCAQGMQVRAPLGTDEPVQGHTTSVHDSMPAETPP